ncbi:uncharacterized protein LOC125498610 [Beta vulgaris subsp. vulgaris]|uniref:uncharacterized protein LOC125498610 n=1 Tax=Beta vulgaris subsp. vulgaris TaxID=3555 RepID=UPI00203700BD|nr:uncharacterized protein LOC125498610 [Beta vulgaris subsp. vulgaris]
MAGEVEDPAEVSAFAKRVCKEACEAADSTRGGLKVEGSRSGSTSGKGEGGSKGLMWAAPEEGWVKINVDVVVKEENGVGLGVVGRDHKGDVLVCGSRRWEWSTAVDEVDALAVRWGMRMAKTRGYRNIVVESDCLSIIDVLK